MAVERNLKKNSAFIYAQNSVQHIFLKKNSVSPKHRKKNPNMNFNIIVLRDANLRSSQKQVPLSSQRMNLIGIAGSLYQSEF